MTTIRLEQSLHGYADGHRMLAASVRLSPPSQRVVRTLTDLSGPRLVSGFDDYLTGYHLPGEGLYAFARTWYATEAERPGCVWTHTLFLSRDSLASVDSLSGLLPMFRRPASESTYEAYENGLTLSLESRSELLSIPTDRLERIVTALYSVTLPVLIPANESNELASTHLALWRHYKTLTGSVLNFCTGAIQPRRGVQNAFDCQTVPDRSIREILRGADEVYIVDLTGGPVSEWARTFVTELPHGSSPELRQALDDYGSFPKDGRSLIGRYAEILHRLPAEAGNERACSSRVFDDIQRLFPERSEASRLKVAVAAGPGVRRFFTNDPDSEILLAVLRDGGVAFDPLVLDAASRLAQIWKARPMEAVGLLKTAMSSNTAFGQAVLDGFSDMCRSSDVAVLSSMGAGEFVAMALRRTVCLAATPEIWRASEEVQNAAIAALTSQEDVPADTLAAVVFAQLENRADNTASPMVERFGICAADAVLKWAIGNKWYLLPSSWNIAFENMRDAFVEWLNAIALRSRDDAFAVPRLITPRSGSLGGITDETWISCLESNRGASLDSYTSALFLVALHAGMTRHENSGALLVARGFPAVYRAARANVLNEHWWKIVEEDLGTRSWWDRCRTLRVGLVSMWVEHRWSSNLFVLALPDDDCFYEILSMWGWSWEEKGFLGSVIRDILNNRIADGHRLLEVARQCERWF